MPNIKQIISLRERYAPKQKINDSFSINETRNYIEGQELRKAFASENLKPLFENINQRKYFSVTAEKQLPEIIKVSIYDNTLTNFANNTVQNKSFGRYFYIHR